MTLTLFSWKPSDLLVLYNVFEMYILKEVQGHDGCEYRKLFVHNEVR